MFFFINTVLYIQNCVTQVTREKGVDKEDLAGRNVLSAVALGLCAAFVPACNGLYYPFHEPR